MHYSNLSIFLTTLQLIQAKKSGIRLLRNDSRCVWYDSGRQPRLNNVSARARKLPWYQLGQRLCSRTQDQGVTDEPQTIAQRKSYAVV